jgi:Secretion system C-terminal sorting domain
MKKILTLTAVFGFSCLSMAQEGQEMQKEVKHAQCSFFMKTAPIKNLMKNFEPIDEETAYENWVSHDRKQYSDFSQISDHGIPENNNIDPARQQVYGRHKGNGTKANWIGQWGANPPDPSGAAGPDHYMQAVNSSWRIYNKDGSSASASYPLSEMWPGTDSDGDPIVMYDRYADRWFISQFQHNNQAPPYSMVMAVSETSDPLGSYYLYEFSFSGFPDYPKFAVWSNAYYMTANSGSNDCVAFEREKMILGDPTASMISMTFPNFYQFFNSVAPAYAEGLWAPEDNEPGWAFAVQDDSWPGINDDHIKVLKIELDWDTPNNSSVVVHQEINTTSFNSVFTGSWDDITQPGTSQKLDAVAGIFMYRAQYRRFPGYNSMLLVTTVDANGANRAGVRWYELREDLTANPGEWYIYQESTFDPNDGNSRWMGNAAMDINGNIGMAYSISGSSEYPGIRYTGRYSTDPLNEMTVEEQIAVDGAGSKTNPLAGNRYGDYSQMTVDPTDDATFWFTGEYMGGTDNARTRIFSFAMWELLGEDEKPVSKPYFNAYQPNTSEVKVMWRDLNDDLIAISVLDMNGKLIAQQSGIDASLENATFSIPETSSGIYLVQVQGENTNLAEKIYLGR